MSAIPSQTQIQDFLRDKLLVTEKYSIYFGSIVDHVADYFGVSKASKKILSNGNRYCHNHESIAEKPNGSVLEQRVEFSLRKLQKDGFVSLIGGNFWQKGNKSYIGRTPSASQVSRS